MLTAPADLLHRLEDGALTVLAGCARTLAARSNTTAAIGPVSR
jgi:hypothetical protein